MDVGPAFLVLDIPGSWQTEAQHARYERLDSSLGETASAWVSACKRLVWVLKCVWYEACKALRYIVILLGILVCVSTLYLPFLALLWVGWRYPHLQNALLVPVLTLAAATTLCSVLCLRDCLYCIPNIILWHRRRWMLKASQKPKRSRKDRLAPLPDIALEKIILQHTSSTDKRALRLTCRYLRNILDRSMTAAFMPGADLNAYMWLWRMRHVSQLRCLSLPQSLTIERTVLELNIEGCVPRSLGSLSLQGDTPQVGWLHLVPSLMNLQLTSQKCMGGEMLTKCSNLTRLEAPNLCLIPNLPISLKHLRVREPIRTDQLSPLTNLRVLVFAWRVPQPGQWICWKPVLAQLPLEHLTWPMAYTYNANQGDEPGMLEHLPRTLKSVGFSHCHHLLLAPTSMPIGVTRLQLLDLHSETVVQTFARAAPGIAQLDVSILKHEYRTSSDSRRIISSIKDVGQFLHLRSLKLYIEGKVDGQQGAVVYDAGRINQAVPELVPLAAMGMAVEVFSRPADLEPFRYNWPTGPEWSITGE